MSAATRIATPYAKSLIDLARERQEIDAVKADMEHLRTSAENADLRNLMQSPVVTGEKKQAVFDRLFPGYHEISKAFIRIVTDKGREGALPEIATAYLDLYREEREISVLKIRSAAPLDEVAIERIKAKLTVKGLIHNRVELHQEVDPELIGGFVVEVGDRLYDASAKTQLETLRKGFTGNLYVNNLR